MAEAVRGVLGLLAVAVVVSLFAAVLSDFAAPGLGDALGFVVVDFDAPLDDEALDLSESAAAIVLLALASDVEVSGLAPGFAVDLVSVFAGGFVSVGVSVRADIDAGGIGAGIVVDESFLSLLAVADLSAGALVEDLSLTD
ncbi:MAG TPA: hypothetical protein VHT71_26635 [Methylomirabilota bacterium]|nr:hypothetical protein [Methylomirabilota bacterium]